MVELTVYPSITTLGVVGTVEGEKVYEGVYISEECYGTWYYSL